VAARPSWYLTSGPATAAGAPGESVPLDGDAALPRLAALWAEQAAGRARFAYPGDALARQLLHRPRPNEVVEVAGGCAVVETREPHDRLLLLCGPAWTGAGLGSALAALVARSRARGRELFMFTTRREIRDAAVGVAMTARDGHVVTLDTGAGPIPAPDELDFQDVDRA
jgi:hypothetical protein